jgi:hypothetical protein
VSQTLDAHCVGGVGLRIENPPESYQRWAARGAQAR